MRIGNQFFRWNGGALVGLTDQDAVAVQSGYTGPSRPPWSTRDPPALVPVTIDGAPYRLEARAAAGVKTLTLVDPQGTRKTIWSLDETIRSVSAEQYRERFR